MEFQTAIKGTIIQYRQKLGTNDYFYIKMHVNEAKYIVKDFTLEEKNMSKYVCKVTF